MHLTRRGFLKAAVVAPIAAALAPLAGQAATREYMRFKAAQLGCSIRGQILFSGNYLVAYPPTMRHLVGIGD